MSKQPTDGDTDEVQKYFIVFFLIATFLTAAMLVASLIFSNSGALERLEDFPRLSSLALDI